MPPGLAGTRLFCCIQLFLPPRPLCSRTRHSLSSKPLTACLCPQALFKHQAQCPLKVTGNCVMCKKLTVLLSLHARSCTKAECEVGGEGWNMGGRLARCLSHESSG